MSWAKRRETNRQEDKTSSLVGIFNVYMPLLYGERRKRTREAAGEDRQVHHAQVG